MLSRRLFLRALAGLPLLGTACRKPPEVAPRWELPETPLRVITTTPQAADLARIIGGKAVSVQSLVAPGLNPHLWKPSAGDVAEMRMADVVLLNGLGLEAGLSETPEGLRGRGVAAVVLGDSVPPEKRVSADGAGGAPDPHFWMSPALWSAASEAVENAFSEAAPDAKAYFAKRAHSYRVDLQDLETWATKLFAEVPVGNRVALLSHPTLGYLAAAHGLQVRSIANARGEGNTEGVEELAGWVKTHRLRNLFREPGVDAAALATACIPLGVKPDLRIFALTLGADGETLPGTSDEYVLDNYVGAFRYTVDTLQSRMALY